MDVAESVLEQVPIAREVIGFLTSFHEKWKARELPLTKKHRLRKKKSKLEKGEAS